MNAAGVLLAQHHRLITHAASIGAHTSGPGKPAQKHRALARRIHSRIEDYPRFAVHPIEPFDNHVGRAREVRMAKLRQKISGGMRTLTGAEHFAALRSYIATTAKHDLGALRALTMLTRQPLAARNHLASYAAAKRPGAVGNQLDNSVSIFREADSPRRVAPAATIPIACCAVRIPPLALIPRRPPTVLAMSLTACSLAPPAG